MISLVTFSPAKVNLFLAVTDRRADGFHNLLSVAAPLDFGDTLWFVPSTPGEGFALECEHAEVPLDATNLILKAARLFQEASGLALGGRFILRKQIPIGAGLGGGSSNASAALSLLNAYSGKVLSGQVLEELAARLGSDCPLFLKSGAVVLRGRGERLDALPVHAAAAISGRRVLLFRPSFGVSTPWAYQQMAADPSTYLPPLEAERTLSSWLSDPAPQVEDLLYNNMESVVFRKYVALPTLLDQIQCRSGLQARMSGSGSCCFVVLPEGFDANPLQQLIREAWGEGCFVKDARLR